MSPQRQTTTSVHLSEDLLTHEQALKILCGALHALRQSDLGGLELQRLRILVDTIQTYDSVLEKYERWVEIEARLLEVDKEIAELKKPRAGFEPATTALPRRCPTRLGHRGTELSFRREPSLRNLELSVAF